MTFSFNVDVDPLDDFENFQGKVLAAWENRPDIGMSLEEHQVSVGTGREATRLVEDAIHGAFAMIRFARIGAASRLRVSFLGHVNPGYAWKDGWSNPMISVSLQIMDYVDGPKVDA